MLKNGARCFNQDPSKKKEHKKFSKNKKIVTVHSAEVNLVIGHNLDVHVLIRRCMPKIGKKRGIPGL